jgi:hypothetical protein
MHHKECVVCKDWVCSECVVEHMVTCSDCSTACCFQCVGRITPVSALDGHSARSLAYLQPLVALEAAAVALAEEEILSNREDRAARVALLGKALAERALAIEKHEASAKVRAFARAAMGFEADGPDAEANIHLPMSGGQMLCVGCCRSSSPMLGLNTAPPRLDASAHGRWFCVSCRPSHATSCPRDAELNLPEEGEV